KGFDTKFGGGPSPIIEGRPVSLPIPGSNGETTTYAERGLAGVVALASRGKHGGETACHDDPMFADGKCWLGQVGAAQGHLRNKGIGSGDVFVFFGLYAEPGTGEKHHRVFGYMQVEATGSPQEIARDKAWLAPPRPHPHFHGEWHRNNAVWFGKGQTARNAGQELRLTLPGETRWSRWRVPDWMHARRPSYLAGDWRWIDRRTLDARGVWQEAVCDIGKAEKPRRWLDGIIAEIEREV
ncbi:hypothetical protein KDA06_05480, partial [Candidatus Saccharibacteria bacterium]|nr:hypothetical protein [Candidatus Saccharibacteria bacterium]